MWPWPWWDTVGCVVQSPGWASPQTDGKWSAPSSGWFLSARDVAGSRTLSVTQSISIKKHSFISGTKAIISTYMYYRSGSIHLLCCLTCNIVVQILRQSRPYISTKAYLYFSSSDTSINKSKTNLTWLPIKKRSYISLIWQRNLLKLSVFMSYVGLTIWVGIFWGYGNVAQGPHGCNKAPWDFLEILCVLFEVTHNCCHAILCQISHSFKGKQPLLHL